MIDNAKATIYRHTDKMMGGRWLLTQAASVCIVTMRAQA